MLHGPVYQTSHMTKLSEKYLTEHYKRKPPPIPVIKTPMREEKFALYASIVMLAILGIGVLGFALG